MKLTKIAIALAMGITSLMGVAQAQEVSKEKREIIQRNISKVNPQVELISVSQTPWNGVFEAVMKGNEIIYTNEDGTYLMATDGREMIFLDIANRKNLTQERLAELNKVSMSAFPKENAFKIKKGKGTHQVSIFADPNCVFCKRYDKAIANLDDITVNVYLYPILSQDSMDKAKDIWCASDKAKVWTDWMVNNVPIPKAKDCNVSAITENLEFGKNIGVSGTPTTFFKDGTRVSGALNGVDLMKKIHAIEDKTKK